MHRTTGSVGGQQERHPAMENRPENGQARKWTGQKSHMCPRWAAGKVTMQQGEWHQGGQVEETWAKGSSLEEVTF